MRDPNLLSHSVSNVDNVPVNALIPHQHLLMDADDTLWENNVHFERAFDAFVTFLDQEHLSPPEIRTMFDQVERATLLSHGYGARGFAHSLRETFIQITGNRDDDTLVRIEQLGLQILDIGTELLSGVQETLNALRPHHDLYLITKGHLEEQQAKIDRSPVAHLFDAHVVVEEKEVETYRNIVKRFELDATRTWMIGNSPKSDIAPALAAGINAIFIPHDMTWHMEHTEIEHDTAWPGRLLELASFTELTTLFQHGRDQP